MQTRENDDEHRYDWVMFRAHTIHFLIRAIDYYITLLGDEGKDLEEDPDLAALITDRTRQEIGREDESDRAHRIRAHLAEKVKDRGQFGTVNISATHWLVRYLKSVAALYIRHLKERRNAIASRRNITLATLSAVDREISGIEELFQNSGVFKDASTLDLLASYPEESVGESGNPAQPSPASDPSQRPRPVLVGSIEILDHELRVRCLDIFNQFQESGQTDRNDTVVSEASRILENRLRTVLNAEDGKSAKQLISDAFSSKNPRLVVSNVASEQEAAQLLFLGTFGFIRNSV